ncbi:MAG: alanine--glyoxylate aminotransferase family protein [Oligoflexia bacterium]|nr:alanine--glyoxylate aminotransferase family protein [Oligoflexia bacterium]
MRKSYLLTPGPTTVPERVLSAMSRPMIHHRTPPFQTVFEEARKGLQYVFQTQQDVLILTASGTGAMEAAITNLFRKGDQVITINGGKFGERWTKLAKTYGLNPVEIKVPAGSAVDPQELEKTVRANPGARAILFQASETSTGVKMPTEAICKIAQAANMVTVCDAITAAGVFDLPMDRWGIDVLISGSQKAFMVPPGLSMIALSERAWKMTETADLPCFYFDLKRERKGLPKNATAWTPAISLVIGLQESIQMIREEGLENVFKRHATLAQATRAGVTALGLELLARNAPSDAVTAVLMPSAIPDAKAVIKLLRDKHGVFIIGGQDELEGKIIRLSHFGYCDKFDITTVLSGLELCLNELGYPVEYGRGVAAALKVFGKSPKES